MVDLVPEVDGYMLYGDRASACYEVRRLREGLKSERR